MEARAFVYTIVFVTLSSLWSCNATCVLPPPGKCSRDNYTVDSNEVCQQDAGNCPFNSDIQGLCHYQQGCADPEMSNWTIVNGKARARQEVSTSNCGGDSYYSVLESPWLQITQPACLKFTYSRERPTALDVFLEEYGGEISTVLNRTNNEYTDNKETEEQKDVASGVRKIIFRAYGGGGTNIQHVNVYNVSVDPGLCAWSGNFSSTPASNDDKVQQWTSPLISSSPTPDTVDCLQFNYTLRSGSTLSVSVQLLNEDRTVTVWTDSNPGNAKRSGTCPLQVTAPFKILFTGNTSPASTAGFSLQVTRFARSENAEYCGINPNNPGTNSDPVMPSDANHPTTSGQCSPLPSTTINTGTVPSTQKGAVTTSSSSERPVSPPSSTPGNTGQVSMQTTSQTSGSGHPTTQPMRHDQSDSNAAVVGGAVGATVVVIALVILVVFLLVRRRQSSKKSGDQTMGKAAETAERAPHHPTHDSHDYTEIRESHFAPSAPAEDGDYSTVDEGGAGIKAADLRPYGRLQDETPEQTHTPGEEDDYHHIGAGEFTNRAFSREAVDDDYHHINSPQAIPEPAESYVYKQVQKKGKSPGQLGQGYFYAEVLETGGTNAAVAAAAAAPSDASNVYIKVNKKPKKPHIAPKPTQGRDDGRAAASTWKGSSSSEHAGDPYNRINVPSSTPSPSGGNQDTDTDTYNRINMSCDPGSGRTASQDDEGVEDEYNALSFDGSGKELAHPTGAAFGAYDHVRNDPDDDYSMTDRVKRHLVIDSDYDHVQATGT